MNDPVFVQLNCQSNFTEEARYVFKIFFTIIGLPYQEIEQRDLNRISDYILISFGQTPQGNSEACSRIHIQEVPYWNALDKLAIAKPGWMEAQKPVRDGVHTPSKLMYLFASQLEALPVVYYFDKERDIPIITSQSNQIRCVADIISSAFYFLSLENEYQTDQRDEYGRFLRSFSPLGEAMHDRAQVDLYANLLQSLITIAAQSINLKLKWQPRWPDKKPFAVCLSHDVDRIRSWTFAKVQRTLKTSKVSGKFSNLVISGNRILRSLLNRSNWSGNIKFISELENLYGGSSTFFFVSRKGSSKDPGYNLSSPQFKKRFDTLKIGGHQIGLHGSFDSYENSSLLLGEKDLLQDFIQREVIGIRQHYLRFSLDKSFDAWEDAGFSYDSTLGFADNIGYRAGISFPFQPFSKSNRLAYQFWEIPLIVMDTILFLENRLFLDADRAWLLMKEYLENTLQTGGCLTLNWHNNNIHRNDVTGYTDIYINILDWCRANNAWICSLNELYEWWNKKGESHGI